MTIEQAIAFMRRRSEQLKGWARNDRDYESRICSGEAASELLVVADAIENNRDPQTGEAIA